MTAALDGEEGAVPVGWAELHGGHVGRQTVSIMTRRTRRNHAWLAIIALVIAASAMIGVTFYVKSRSESLTDGDIWQKVSWRAKLYALKVTGGVPDFSWNELLQVTQQQGGFGLESVFRDGLGLDGSVHNPYVSQDDFNAGKRTFREHCALCHGGREKGSMARR